MALTRVRRFKRKVDYIILMSNPIFQYERWQWKRYKKRHLAEFIPNETFIESCSSDAMLITRVDEDGSLTGIDLIDRKIKSCNAFHCGPVILEPLTALTISILGDDFKEAKAQAFTLFEEARKESKHNDDTQAMLILCALRAHRGGDAYDLSKTDWSAIVASIKENFNETS